MRVVDDRHHVTARLSAFCHAGTATKTKHGLRAEEYLSFLNNVRHQFKIGLSFKAKKIKENINVYLASVNDQPD